MKIGIHSDNNSFSERWIAYCEENNIPYKLVNCYQSDIIRQLSDCEALMWHFNHKGSRESKFAKQLLYSVQAAGKHVFPDYHTVWHFDDKVGQKYLLEAIDAPLAHALNLIIEEAVRAHSSDIHIEPEEDRVRVRYRIDGTLHDMMSLPLSVHRAIISRIKILADMNIADHHHPQDGQISTQAKGRDIDVRVATAPTVYGELAVLRLLDKSRAMLGLSQLGFLPDDLVKYETMLKVPYGMILVSGPTIPSTASPLFL